MLVLAATNETLELATSGTSAVDVVANYTDITATTFDPDSQETAITTATTTTILGAPAASTKRQVKLLTITNKGTAANTVTIKKDIAGTEYHVIGITLQAGENLIYTDGDGFSVHARNGERKAVSSIDKSAPLSARSFNILKVGAATEAAGILHTLALASGQPGAWSPGTPGLNGRATDGTAAGDAGCIPIKNASSGSNYLTSFIASLTTASSPMLIDLLWVNTGLVVTTTTAQAITPAALPARDAAGSTNGDDVMAGILVTTATTNASAITNMTISYTNQDGTAGRTGTIASFPATAVAGSIIPVQLQAGDTGIRSVQSVTLGTSLVTGAVSLILYRMVAMTPQLVANAGGQFQKQDGVNVKLFNGACLLPCYVPTATTASTLSAVVNVEEK